MQSFYYVVLGFFVCHVEPYNCRCRDVDFGVIISIKVLCNDTVIIIVNIQHDGKRLGLPNTPVAMKCDNGSIEQSTAIALNITLA